MEENEVPQTVIQVKKSRGGGIFAFFAGIALLVVAGFACFHFFVTKTSTAPVERFAEALSSIFGSEVTVTGSTAVLEKSEIGELALVQRKTQAITKYETVWMGSKKVLIVRGDFLVKAGFDLSEGGQWGLLEGRVDGPIPRGKVLSVESIGEMEIYHSKDGTINKLSSQDAASAFNYLKNQARRDAERSDIGEEAERVLLRRINDRMNADSEDGGVQWGDSVMP